MKLVNKYIVPTASAEMGGAFANEGGLIAGWGAGLGFSSFDSWFQSFGLWPGAGSSDEEDGTITVTEE